MGSGAIPQNGWGATMARERDRLTALQVKNLATEGRHADGGGLYAVVGDGRRNWTFMFRWDGKRKELGLGSLDTVPLAKAREYAAQARLAVQEGRNPLEERRAAKQAERQAVAEAERARARLKTFGEVADGLIASKGKGWRNDKHRAQWIMTLNHYAEPIRALPVGDVGTEEILAILQPIWAEKGETASRLRGRIEAVIDAGRAKGLVPRDAPNPARWKGHLDHLLPPPQKLKRGHHAALPWQEMPAFMATLRGRLGTAPKALEWIILSAARVSEALGARWREIDLETAVWTVPKERMKAKREHRVPLSQGALDLLAALPPGGPDDFVFPGRKRGKPLSNMVFKALFVRMGALGITSHGFRSTFRDWAGEATGHAREVAEAALAHSVGNAVELAYRRGDALEKRRRLMADWYGYCAGGSEHNVVPIRATAAVGGP